MRPNEATWKFWEDGSLVRAPVRSRAASRADLKPGVDRSAFVDAINYNRVSDAVEFFDARPGDVVYIPPGTVHALCAGVLVYEVQQSSDITFRIYDYNRPGADGKPRELHIDRRPGGHRFRRTPHVAHPRSSTIWLGQAFLTGPLLVESEHFRLERFSPSQDKDPNTPPYASLAALTLLSGSAEIQGGDEACRAGMGDTFLIPADRDFTVNFLSETPPEYLVSSVP